MSATADASASESSAPKESSPLMDASPASATSPVSSPLASPLSPKDEEVKTPPSSALNERAVTILQTDPYLRTADDLAYLEEWIVSLRTSFFKELDAALIRELCKVVSYEKIPANKTVFRQGDQANRLYVIIRGSVSLWVTNDKHDMEYPDPKSHTLVQIQKLEQNTISSPSIQKMQIERTLPVAQPSKRASLNSSLKIDTMNVPKDPTPTRTVVESPEKRRIRVMTNPSSPKRDKARRSIVNSEKATQEIFIGFIRAGGPKTSFGELGLISDTTRSATIRTDLADCEFLTVDKADFDRVLKSKMHEALAAKVARMKNFKLFNQMSDVHLNKIALHLETRMIGPKQLVSKEGNPATHISFLLKGTMELTKLVHEDKDKHGNLKTRQVSSYEQVSQLHENEMYGAVEALSEPAKPLQNGLRSVTECEFWQIERGELLRRARSEFFEELFDDGKEDSETQTP